MRKADIPWLIALVLCAVIAVVFGFPEMIPYTDAHLGALISETVPRLAVGVFLILLMRRQGYAESLRAEWSARNLLWCIPCFLVALANFPFSALIGGAAILKRADLLWIFLLKCLSIALLEEVFFRGLLVPVFMERLRRRRGRVVLTVLFTSAVFALSHLVNLFFGAGFAATALQVGYAFLVGGMAAVMLLKTKNLWLCVLVHMIFDVGGLIVTDLGTGVFQDTVFWSLTAVAGAICAVHILFTMYKLHKSDVARDATDNPNQ